VVALAAGCGDSRGINAIGTDAAAGAPEAGGNDAAATSPSISCGDPNQPIDPTALIDDMEDGNFMAAMIGGRSGSWWAGGDATPGASMQPDGNAPPEPIPGGRCGSHYAMHVTGNGFNDWGATLSVSFKFGTNDAGVAGAISISLQSSPDHSTLNVVVTQISLSGSTPSTAVRPSVHIETCARLPS